MFFCDECGKENGWPPSLYKSHGPCEMCGKSTLCSDVPSALLPEVRPKGLEKLDAALQRSIDKQLDRAIYKGGRLTDNELTLTFEKEGKTFDLRIMIEQAGTMGTGTPFLTPILKERRL